MYFGQWRQRPAMLTWLFITFLVFLLLPQQARANGGAPNLAYVAGGDGGVTVIDVAQKQVTKNIQVDGKPEMVQLSLDGRFLYVTQPELNKVSLVGARAGNIVCSANVPGKPDILAVDQNTNLLFAAGSGDSTVTSIDVKDDKCTVKQTFKVDGPVYGLGVAILGSSSSSGAGNQLWVASTDAITVFDNINGQQIAKISIPEGPRYISTPPGTAAYVTTQQGTVVAIDFNTHKTLTLFSGGDYGPMDYDAITGKIYVPDRQNNQIVILNPVDANFIKPENLPKPLDLGVKPASIAITSDGQLGFVALEGGNTAMFDIPGRLLITTIKVGGEPQFIITGVYPPTLGDTPEQANTIQTIATIGAYVIVVALLVVPILLFRRYARAREQLPPEQEQELDMLDDEDEEEDEDVGNVQKRPATQVDTRRDTPEGER